MVLWLLLLPALPAWSAPVWQPWTPASFERARDENKYLFLYLEAKWCHWCHVMQADTLSNPQVLKILQRDYISVRVDHDAHPALANQYRNWGWPALIFLAPDGTEIVKRAGYRDPAAFSRLLSAIVADPTPEAAAPQPREAPTTSQLEANVAAELRRRHVNTYDSVRGGLDMGQKYIDRDSVEYGLVLAATGDAQEKQRVLQTLDAARQLIDPVWGGVYQYSTGGNWQNPHYEKIMRSQAGVLRTYAMAYAQFGRKSDAEAAADIRDYMLDFLQSEEGGFYVSQDADLIPGQKAHDYFALDDVARRQRGMPRIDTHRYAQQNGLAIEALALWYEMSGDEGALQAALRAASWVKQHRRQPDGVYSHASADGDDVYLEDNLAMARASLQLYRATAEKRWLKQAMSTANVIISRFLTPSGFANRSQSGVPVQLRPDLDVNLSLARFMNLLAAYSGDARHVEAARHAAAFLFDPETALSRITDPGLLLLAREMASAPLHLSVVGHKDDAVAAELYSVAQRYAGWFKRLDWWDRRQGALTNLDVAFPEFSKAAGYVCNGNRCSLPSFESAKFAERVALLAGG